MTKKAKILITGGAGYIGSHVLRQLGERDEALLTIDDLSTGNRAGVLYGDFVLGNCGDYQKILSLLQGNPIDTVIHFAASMNAGESVDKPLLYYDNNIVHMINLLKACVQTGVKYFIFSSSCSVYGDTKDKTITEATPCNPINPYGRTKYIGELILADCAHAYGLKHASLRYFNAAGADPQLRNGSYHRDAEHLLKRATLAALGTIPHVEIFGTDYPTHDGTCVRDYIHVEDLADAHVKALDHLRSGGDSFTVNIGYGHGYSVREMLAAVQKASSNHFKIVDGPRREGDPAQVIADNHLIREKLNWQPRYDDLDTIVTTALEWEKKIASEYA